MGAILKDIKLTDIDSSGSEIVTVAELKTYLQIEGTAYDGPLAIFIKAARQMIEAYTATSLFPKTAITTIHTTGYKPFKLPYKPVDAITLVRWKKCPSEWVTLVADEDYNTNGNDAIFIESSDVGLHEVTYTLGVDGSGLYQQAVKAQAGYMFTNRDSQKLAVEVEALLSNQFSIS